MRAAPNRADPHGYYAELGVRPDATPEQIRARARVLYRRYHPDTGTHPDVEKFSRIHNIAEVLLDPDARHRYNTTPPGLRLMDKVYASELSKLDLDHAELQDALRPRKPPGRKKTGGRYDYFAYAHTTYDNQLAGMWYHHLVATAPRTGYRQVIKVLLFDHYRPMWNSVARIIMIPRVWEPSSFAAYALLTHVIGASLLNTPTRQHDSRTCR